MFFIPLMIAIAAFWLAIGTMLARYLAQKYKGKPWRSGRPLDEHNFIYGTALRNDNSRNVHGGGGFAGYGDRGMSVGSGYGRQNIGMGQYGQGRVKGL